MVCRRGGGCDIDAEDDVVKALRYPHKRFGVRVWRLIISITALSFAHYRLRVRTMRFLNTVKSLTDALERFCVTVMRLIRTEKQTFHGKSTKRTARVIHHLL